MTSVFLAANLVKRENLEYQVPTPSNSGRISASSERWAAVGSCLRDMCRISPDRRYGLPSSVQVRDC
jgi:hypothetical protein